MADVPAFMPFKKSMISVRPAGGVAHHGAGVRASCVRLARGCIVVSICVDRETTLEASRTYDALVGLCTNVDRASSEKYGRCIAGTGVCQI